MANLIAKSPLSGQGPVTYGSVTLSEAPIEAMQSLAPIKGQEKVLAKALKTLGLAMPTPNTCVAKGHHLIVWTGRDQVFLMGPAPVTLAGAAITDQSDGWARLRLEGAGVADVLMRLVPMDLRRLAQGWAARAPLNHMQAVLVCAGTGQIDILVFRSMAQTAWHEVADTMQMLAARAQRPS